MCVNVPGGPKYATVIASRSDAQALLISRNTASSAWLGKGPPKACWARWSSFTTAAWASTSCRGSTNAAALSGACRTSWARSFSNSRIRRSSESIRCSGPLPDMARPVVAFDGRTNHRGGMDLCVVRPTQEFGGTFHHGCPQVAGCVQLSNDEQSALEGHAGPERTGETRLEHTRRGDMGCVQLVGVTRSYLRQGAVGPHHQMSHAQQLGLAHATHRPGRPRARDCCLLLR